MDMHQKFTCNSLCMKRELALREELSQKLWKEDLQESFAVRLSGLKCFDPICVNLLSKKTHCLTHFTPPMRELDDTVNCETIIIIITQQRLCLKLLK